MQRHAAQTASTAPDLVLIHGWGMHGGVWQSLISKLIPNFNVHVLDLPGMGFSPPLAESGTQALAEQVAQHLPEKADICGWSLGGQVAMRIALLQPQRVRRLVLVGATPCFVNSDDWQQGMEAKVFEKFASQIGENYQSTLIKFLSLQCMGASDARVTIKQLRESLAERPLPALGALENALRLLLETDLRAEINQLKLPVLLMHGDRDTLAPLSAAQWLAQHLPASRLQVFAGASHAPFLSHSETFVAALIEFLK
ncbi:MAG: pimeloyl-ACP methyl ester esterase BioH [Methylophilaceae bacterium]